MLEPNMCRGYVVSPIEHPRPTKWDRRDWDDDTEEGAWSARVTIATDIEHGRYVFEDEAKLRNGEADADKVLKGAVLLVIGTRVESEGCDFLRRTDRRDNINLTDRCGDGHPCQGSL